MLYSKENNRLAINCSALMSQDNLAQIVFREVWLSNGV